MNNKFLHTTLILLILFFGCQKQRNNHLKEMGKVKIIDFNSFKKIETEDIYQYTTKQKKYIKLDNSCDDFLFKGIDKIKILGERIYILDRKLKKLIVFDIRGKGIGTVGKRGQGPQEYLQISDFAVSNSGNIYFIDGTLGESKLFVFDKDLHFISLKKMPFEADIIHCLTNGKLLFGLSSWNQGKNAQNKIIRTNEDGNVEQSYLQYDKYVDNAYWISFYMFVETEDAILYNKQIDNHVYQFSLSGNLLKSYYFDFGRQNVPDEDKMNIERDLDKFKQYCCLKDFTIITDKYIAGTIWDKTQSKNFIIDIDKQTMYLSKEIASSDISNMANYYDNQIISFIYPGKYDDSQLGDLPQDIKKHVEEDNFVLCLNKLK